MKNLIFFLFLLQFPFYSNAQIVNIPDPNFKARLIFNGVDQNQDGEIQKIEAEEVIFLSINGSEISDLTGLEAFTEVSSLFAGENPFTSIDVSGMKQLSEFHCSNTNIEVLNLNSLLDLSTVMCRYNPNLTNVTIINCPDINVLNFTSCNISILDISNSGITSLSQFYCNNNKIDQLDISGINRMDIYDFSFNLLTEIDFTDLTFSINGSLYENLLHSIDFGESSCFVSIHNNPLEYLFIKESNGDPNLFGVPSLKYICAKNEKIVSLQAQVNALGYNCQVNSYCSFTPGGESYTLKGIAKFDENSDGCGISDFSIPQFKFGISNGIVDGNFYTDGTGIYDLSVGSGNHTIVPTIENAAYFNIEPPLINVTFPGSTDPYLQDICLTPSGGHNDVEVVMIPVTGSRPGFDAVYKLIYNNVGTTTLSSEIQLNFEDDFIDFISASIAPDVQISWQLNWNYTDLLPFEKREILLTFHLNSPMDSPPLNGGENLNFQSRILPMDSDENSTNNSFDLVEPVVNSFDPNDKTCLQGNILNPDLIGNYIYYLIRFENTGTANAINIVVKDIIDTNRLDISSLSPVDASHDHITRITGNNVEFIFENINLPFDDGNNDGFIIFKIKTLPTLHINDEIKNKAEIYFDFNFPIITNEEVSVIGTLGTNKYSPENPAISIIPSLVTDHFTVIGAKQISSIEIFNSTGKLISLQKSGSSMVDTQTLLPGIYLVRVNGDGGHVVRRVIKG